MKIYHVAWELDGKMDEPKPQQWVLDVATKSAKAMSNTIDNKLIKMYQEENDRNKI